MSHEWVTRYRAVVFTTAGRNGRWRVDVSGSRRKPDLISRTRRISTYFSDSADHLFTASDVGA